MLYTFENWFQLFARKGLGKVFNLILKEKADPSCTCNNDIRKQHPLINRSKYFSFMKPNWQ